MSCSVGGGGLLPPVPDLIPISTTASGGMGEQRSRRSVTGKQQQQQQQQHRKPSDDNNSCCKSPCSSSAAAGIVIDSKSRGVCSADASLSSAAAVADVPPATRKAVGGSEHHQRHRKLDRRREHTQQLRKHNNNNNNISGQLGLNGGYSSSGDNSGEDNSRSDSSVPPVNPRVNPIFVWVKQENSRIVDVKCEDYDKRNRILLTKTAQGWRAIPRTETAPPTKRRPDDNPPPPPRIRNGKIPAKVHKGHRRGSKVKRKSTAVQVDDDLQQGHNQQQQQQQHPGGTTTTTNAPEENLPPQDWNDPVNIESHLPSHTILVSSRLNAIAAVATATTSCAQPTCTTTSPLATTNDRDDDDDAAAAATAASAPTAVCDDQVNIAISNRCNNALTIECPVPKICEPSPLDNLLAVAELEFNQQFNQGRHSDDDDDDEEDQRRRRHHHHHQEYDVVDDKIVDDYDENMEHLTSFINSCTAAAEAAAKAAAAAASAISEEQQESSQLDIPAVEHDLNNRNSAKEPSDCDYRDDDDDNTLAMDDILNRLEQSLRSPDTMHTADMNEMLTNVNDVEESLDTVSAKEAKRDVSRTAGHDAATITTVERERLETEQDSIERKLDTMDDDEPEDEDEEEEEEEEEEQLTHLRDDCPNEMVHDELEAIVEDDADKPCDNDKVDFEPTAATNLETDLVVKTPILNEEAIVSSTPDFPTDLSKKKLDDCTPTDLSVPKNKVARNSPPPRPQSQSSETMQSPQPSGIPAVPPSPDIVQTPGKVRSAFLETMLSAQPVKSVGTTVADINAKEPLNLGKNRESASPTVTCSEEVKSRQNLSEDEPVYKKFKMEDITIKTLLDAETERNKARKASEEKTIVETPKLLELLTNEADLSSPVTQLKQLLSIDKVKIPDPMLIPKDRLSLVLTNPLKEIPKLLTQRPELRLPEVLDYPELLQDPNMLVITLEQLQTIIYKQSGIPKESRVSSPKQRSGNVEKKLNVEAKHLPHQQQQQNHREHQLSSGELTIGKLQQSSSKSTSKEPPPRNGEKTQHNQEENSIASDLNAATSAMLNQMMWLPYLNQLESLNYGMNNNSNNSSSMEFLKMLRTIRPQYTPMMPSDTVSQMLAAHRFPGQHFPMSNFNPEIAMWQEAMLQASLLRQRNPYELFNGNKESREFSGNKSSTAAAAQHVPTGRHPSTKAKQQSTSYATGAAAVKSNPYASNLSAYHHQQQQQVSNVSASARTSSSGSSSLNHHHQSSTQKSASSTPQHQSSNRSQSNNQRHQPPPPPTVTTYNGHNTFMDYLPSGGKDAYHKEQYNLQKDYLSKDNYLLQKQQQLQMQQQQQQQQMNDAMSQYMKQQQQAHLQQQQQQSGCGGRSSERSSAASARDVRERNELARDASGYKSVSCKSFASLIAGEQQHGGGGSASQLTSGTSGGGNRKEGVGLTVERTNSNKQHYSAPMDLSNITPHSSTHQNTSLSAAATLTTLSATHNTTTTNPYSNSNIPTSHQHHHQQQQHQLQALSSTTSTSTMSHQQQHYNQPTALAATSGQQQQQQQQQQTTVGKIKVKQHLVDPNLQPPKLLKRLSEAEHEVGSTTDMDMQDMAAQNTHLWHPLFGNQKSYSSPWNWTTVTATGE